MIDRASSKIPLESTCSSLPPQCKPPSFPPVGWQYPLTGLLASTLASSNQFSTQCQRDNFEVLIVITFQSSLKPHNGLPIALRVKIQLSIMVHKGRLTLVYFCSLTSCSFHSTLVSLIANSVPSSPYIPFTIARSLYQWFLLIFQVSA